ncbi:MAG: hypothetical protein Q4A08_09475 [Bacteroidales bacterium]|nr:hypothetical protein [Bacteroidales bacterium]
MDKVGSNIQIPVCRADVLDKEIVDALSKDNGYWAEYNTINIEE